MAAPPIRFDFERGTVAEERMAKERRSNAHEAGVERQAYTFYLDPALVDRARQAVSEGDMVRSIEAALAAAIDYHLWIREVAAGERDVLG